MCVDHLGRKSWVQKTGFDSKINIGQNHEMISPYQ